MTGIPGASRGRGRPRVTIQRPKKIAIRDGIVRCYYGKCSHTAGPYVDRDDAVAHAIAHWERRHKKDAPDAV